MKFEGEIKKWGNSAALRISSFIVNETSLAIGTKVIMDTAGGELKVISKEKAKRFTFPLSEKELIQGLTAERAHADELGVILDEEWPV